MSLFDQNDEFTGKELDSETSEEVHPRYGIMDGYDGTLISSEEPDEDPEFDHRTTLGRFDY